ncbi:hypothetical protein MKZ38_005193 [Zalerion maritima]|uniref:SWR1-complex protein 4 n=1 Tax=Zalerion maritima TaxID=339359 RepID=A0AAD5WUB9_9PEZI|nr:hypothetical protein MKZ38_005193 [Zalerion maritima]
MTSLDARDVLGIPADGSSRPAKKVKISAPRQSLKGLAREVQSLGGNNPIAIVPATSTFKKRRLGSRKPAARWKLEPFKNSAREGDSSLVLRHWKRVGELGVPPPEEQPENGDGEPQELEDSAFAKFSVQVQVPQYSEDQYNSNLQNSDWTKEETDYLLHLSCDFDLRWSIIWDRYDYKPHALDENGDGMALVLTRKERDIDDLKARYYEVAAKMMAAQTPVTYMPPQQQHLHNVMANYSAEKERARRKFAADTLSRSKEEAKEEESLLLELKRIDSRAEQLNEQRKDLYDRLDYPATGEGDLAALKTSSGLQQLLATLSSVDRTKKNRKSIQENGTSPNVQTPVPESAGGYGGHGRRDSTVSGHGHRDSIGGDSAAATPTTSRAPAKKGSVSAQAAVTAAAATAAQQERRRLTDMEEIVYGVSHHDRLTGGATFRYEKINKLFSHKSGQQQQRITNVLAELGIPPRLQMPTGAVVSRFEGLIGHVNTLLDSRKLSDKLDAELKTEMAKKQHRLDMEERARKAAEEEEKKRKKEVGEEGNESAAAGEGEGEGSKDDDQKAQTGEKNGGNESASKATSEHQAGDAAPAGSDPPVKQEVVSRPGSSGQKRSVSVLSTVDDEKAVKRQKK